jgi:hypothetical protein
MFFEYEPLTWTERVREIREERCRHDAWQRAFRFLTGGW